MFICRFYQRFSKICICPKNDSKIYEGRGFDYEGQHTSNNNATEYNSIGICVTFIGNYEHETISESQVKVFHDFIEFFKLLFILKIPRSPKVSKSLFPGGSGPQLDPLKLNTP